MALSLDKVQQQAPELVSLAKEAQRSLDLRGLTGTQAKVALVLDYSGSMSGRYRNGEVQAVAERALALGTQLDDDGSIDVFIFGSTAHYVGELTLENYKGGIDRLVAPYRMGTTDYAGAFREVRNHFFPDGAPGAAKRGFFGRSKGEVAKAALPVFAEFVTDGSPDSKTAATNELVECANFPIFWKFLSVGSEEMKYLQKLDDLTNRRIDNADYKPVGEIARLSDQEVFDLLVDEYPEYLQAARQSGILA